MRIKQVRRNWQTANQRLRRARLLYGRLTYAAFLRVPLDKRDRWFDYVADAALFRGLWSSNYGSRSESRRNVRYALCRAWWRLTPGYEENGPWSGWSLWMADYGFAAVSFRSYPGAKVAA